jgi:hypothetical protein
MWLPATLGIWMDARMVTLYKVEYKFAASEKKRQNISKRRKFMFRNYVVTLSVLSLFVTGQAVTAYAADDAAPPYPNWAAAVVPAYPHARPLSSPIAARAIENVWTRNDRPNAGGGGVVQSAREGCMVAKRRRSYLVY